MEAPAHALDPRPAGPLRRIAVRRGDRITLVATDEIDAILASGNNVRIVVSAHAHVVRDSLTRLESLLARDTFVRIHRSAIINLDRVIDIVTDSHGDGQVRMAGGCIVPMSRAYRKALRGRFGPEF